MLDKADRVEANVLKIIKGSMVMIQGDTVNSLYVLQVQQKTNDVNITFNQIQDKTFLRHLRLGHISEKRAERIRKLESSR